MAMPLLTAEDVHYKRFTPTKFREGYDQDEVDEFLDQVVETIATLEDENNRMKQGGAVAAPVSGEDDGKVAQLEAQLQEANARIEELQNQASAALASARSGDKDADQHLLAANNRIGELEAAVANLEASRNQLAEENEGLKGQVAQLQHVQDARFGAEGSTDIARDPEDASSMLALAQRVHDEYVRNGEEEGRKLVEEARSQGDQIIAEANNERATILAQLESDRSSIQSRVDDLKRFEGDYRNQIREHLQRLMNEVNNEG